MTKSIHPALIVVLLSAFLGGCSTFSSSDSGCMKTVLVTTVSKTPLSSARKGDTRTVTISHFKGGCERSKAQLLGEKDKVGINLTLTAPEAKPATGSVKKIAFPVFVALLDKEDNVLDRYDEIIKVTVSDEPLNHTHKITYRPPEGIDIGGDDHRLLIGFNGNAKAAPSEIAKAPIEKKVAPKKSHKGKVKRKKVVKKRARQ